jgi:uncharacterized damage-inducible protein DinB
MSLENHDEILNPYLRFLKDHDPFTVLASTPERLAQLIGTTDEELLRQNPSPKKWSVRDILCHLADTETAYAFRLRQTVSEQHHLIQPYDQDSFAAAYEERTSREGLETFTAIRRWNLLFIRSAVPAALPKAVTHPERGTMTFQTILETMAGHDLNHVSQITALLA